MNHLPGELFVFTMLYKYGQLDVPSLRFSLLSNKYGISSGSFDGLEGIGSFGSLSPPVLFVDFLRLFGSVGGLCAFFSDISADFLGFKTTWLMLLLLKSIDFDVAWLFKSTSVNVCRVLSKWLSFQRSNIFIFYADNIFMTTESIILTGKVSEHIAQENWCLLDICFSSDFVNGLVVSNNVTPDVL